MLRTELIAPIPELLRRQADRFGDKTAFTDRHDSVTYQDLLRRTGNLAGHLQKLGLAVGDRVAVFLPNSVAWIVAGLATVRAGGVVVSVSYESSDPEVRYRLQDAGCRVLITTAAQLSMIAAMRDDLPDLERVIVADATGPAQEHPAFETLMAEDPGQAPRDPDDIDVTSYIIYTSGTTGRAKGVLLTTRGMLWVTAACWAPIANLNSDDVVLSPLPLFHSYALNLSVLSIVAVGATEHIMEKFSTDSAIALLQSGRFTLFPGVPTMFHYLLQSMGDVTPGVFPTLTRCISAGAIMPAALNVDFEARTGVPLLDGYGITETSTMVTMNWPSGGRVMGSCGLPVPGLATRIVDPATGRDVDRGTEGELIVRGPNVMPGYHNKPKETAEALQQGWYRTGDLAVSDENGFLTITGRLKELIIRGGQNIAPAEVEDAVMRFEPVLDCAVIGLAHEALGEVPVVFIVEATDNPVDDTALLDHCRGLLPSYKVPAAIHRTDVIPRTGSGKTMRFKLQETLA